MNRHAHRTGEAPTATIGPEAYAAWRATTLGALTTVGAAFLALRAVMPRGSTP
ncbi:MAG: hypothetical protein ACREEL_11875 [Stellaceae bacterium]